MARATQPIQRGTKFINAFTPWPLCSPARLVWQQAETFIAAFSLGERGDPTPVDNDEPDIEVIKARYQNDAAMIENIDYHIGRMVELVKARGELDNTLIVYANDRGEMLGDHNR